LNCLSGRTLFYKLSYASFRIENNERTIFLKGEIGWGISRRTTM